MRPGGGKQKGDSYERHIANLLSEWYYGEKGIIVRTAGSGGWPKKGKLGTDLIAVPEVLKDRGLPEFPAVVECKNRAEIQDFRLMLTEPNTPLLRFWDKFYTEAAESPYKDRQRWLIFTRNRWPDYIMMTEANFTLWIEKILPNGLQLFKEKGISYFALFLPKAEPMVSQSVVSLGQMLIVLKLQSFLEVFSDPV